MKGPSAVYQQDGKRKLDSLCKEFYNLTKGQRDEAIDDIFAQAGALVAGKVVAVQPRVDESTLDEGLNIICVGSIFNSWDLLQPSLVELLSLYLTTSAYFYSPARLPMGQRSVPLYDQTRI